jgi:putative tryptophan/tyrosine transport system substrate-binding protein
MGLGKITLTILSVLGLVFGAELSAAQQPPKIPRVGLISPGAASGPAQDMFRQALEELGYRDGRNVVIESRSAQGELNRLPELTAELVSLKVDVIAVVGAVTARAAMKASTNIPIVFTVVLDPIPDGLVSNLERPGGNVTGITSFDPQQASKQLKLLKEAIPGLVRVAILGDLGVTEALMNSNKAAAEAQGLQPLAFRVKGPTPDLEGAFAKFKSEHADALVVLEEPITVVHYVPR